MEEKRQAQYQNAINLQAKASQAIKHERKIQGLDLLSTDELKARRQAAYDTRKHYEANLENGVYETQGAVKEAMDEISTAKDVSNAIDAILKSRDSEDEKKRKEEDAEQEKENKLNSDAWVRLQKFTREEQLQSFGTELKSMRPGELRRIGMDLFAVQDQLKHQYKEQLETGNIEGATETEKELEDTKSRLEMIADVLKSTMDIEGLGTYGGQLLGDEGAKGYDVGQYDSVENALFRAQLDTSKQISQNVIDLKTTLQTINDTTIQMRNQMNQNNGGGTYG